MGDLRNPAAVRRAVRVLIRGLGVVTALAVVISGVASASSAQDGRSYQYGTEPELNPLYPRWVIQGLPGSSNAYCGTELALVAARERNLLPLSVLDTQVLVESLDAATPELPTAFEPPIRVASPAEDWTRQWTIVLDLGLGDTPESFLKQYGFEYELSPPDGPVAAVAPVGADVVGIRNDPRFVSYKYRFGVDGFNVDVGTSVDPGTYAMAIADESLAQNPDCAVDALTRQAKRLEAAGAKILNVPGDDLEIVFRADQRLTFSEERPLRYDSESVFVSTQLVDDSPRCGGYPVTIDLAAGDVPTDGDDVILGTDGDDEIAAGAGNDVVCGRGGDDTIFGQDGDDYLLGGDGSDKLRGGNGNDVALGQGGGDNISGGRGDDLVSGGDDDDSVRGGVDDDVVWGGAGNDSVVSGNGGRDVIFGGDGDDRMGGGPRDDVMHGGGGADTMQGLTGHDVLFGGAGDDILAGGAQADRLLAGPGNDSCRYGTSSPISDWTEDCTVLDPPATTN